MEFLLERGARLYDLREEIFIFGQQMVDFARSLVGLVRVFKVQVIIAGLNLVDGHTPSMLVLHAVIPPLALGLELLNADGFALVVALGTGRIRMLVIPDFGGGLALGEKKGGWCGCQCRD